MYTLKTSLVLTTATALALLIILAIIRRTLNPRLRWLPLPPGPPITGWCSGHTSSLPLIKPWKVYAQWAKAYGSVIHLRTYHQHSIVLSSIDDCVELLERRSNIYSDKPSLAMVDLMGWNFATGLVEYGSRWRRHRRLLQQHLKQSTSLSYRPKQTCKIIDMLLGLLISPQHFREHVKLMTASIVMSITYGYDVKHMNDPFVSVADEATSRLSEAVFPGAALVNVIPILRLLPRWFPGTQFHSLASETKKLTTTMKEVPFAFAQKNMNTHRPSNCLIDFHWPLCKTPEDVTILQECAAVMYVAGAHTTDTVIQSFFYAMMMYPSVQAKAQQEIDAVIGIHRLPTYNDRSSLPLIDAILREVMRWRPTLPLGVAHAVMEDDVYKGYLIPKGAVIIPNVWAISRDEKRYINPEEFNPERFLDVDGNLIDDDTDYLFGFGRRICPGRHLARTTAWLSIATILWAFNISNPQDIGDDAEKCKDVDYTDGLISHPHPHECTITPRHDDVARIIQEAVITQD